MDALTTDDFPLAQRLAAAHSAALVKDRLAEFLTLDSRLGQFVSQSKEPMLTQMRLAWWRDQLGKPVADRPQGDPVLNRISSFWQGEEQALIALVNGWEALLAEPPIPVSAVTAFTDGRAKSFAAVARLCNVTSAEDSAYEQGQRWALADLAARIGDAEEREIVIYQAQTLSVRLPKLPYKLRALTILGSLGKRALESNGAPLISGRSDVLLVMRIGLLGR